LSRLAHINKRRVFALAAVLVPALVLSGCVAFTGPITVAQQDTIGKVRVSFTICATDPSNHPGCDEATNAGSFTDSSPRAVQALAAFRVPRGTVVPASFSSVAGEALTFTRSASYEGALTEQVAPPAGQQWVGYMSQVYNYDPGPNGTEAKRASFAVDLGLPSGSDGRPFAAPFTVRPVVGGRRADGAPGTGTDPNRPVRCGDDPFASSGGAFADPRTICIDSPDRATTATNIEAATRDLGLAGTQVAANPGQRVTVPFTARYVGSVDPDARFTLSGQSAFRRTPVRLSRTVLVPAQDSSNQVTTALTVPKKAAAGHYLVGLYAKLPNGQQRVGVGAVRVRDKLAPVARGLDVVPDSFTPFPDTSSIAASKGARVRYRLSEAATMRFTVQRRVRGRYRTVKGSFRHKGKKGVNRFRFTGFVRRRALRPGAYRLVGVPVDEAKNKGRAVRTRFRIRR
jgi:hypothetical protein